MRTASSISAWTEYRVKDLLGAKAHAELHTAHPQDSYSDVIALLKRHDISQVPVVEDGRLLGLVTEVDLLDHLLTSDHRHQAGESIAPIIRSQVATVSPDTPLETLMSVFTTGRAVLVVLDERLVGIVTKIDLLDFLAGQVR